MAGPWEQYAQAAPAEAAGPWAKYAKPAEQDFSFKPERDMTRMERGLAGAGKALSDLGQGAGQLVGLVSRDDVAETRKRDAPLMDTTAGKVGNLGGNVAMLATTARIPGANTIVGAGAIGAGMGLLQPSTSTRETAANVALGGAFGAGGQAIANKLPGLLGKRVADASAQQAGNAQKFAAARTAAGEGYVVPPVDLEPGMLTQALSGLSGKIKTEQVASQRNQLVTDNLAKKALGLTSDQPLSADVLQSIRQKAAQQGYAPLRNAGTVTADQPFLTALDNIASTQQGAARSFPGLADNGVTELVAKLRQPAFDAGDAIDATRVLRDIADKAYRQGDKTLGKASKEAAGAVEDMLGRHLQASGQPDALQAFQEARKLIAKTYTVQKGLNTETGNVAAGKLAAQLQKGAPLSGELRTIAETATAFPKATQMLKEAPGAISPLDWAVAGSAALGSGSPIPLALLGARPLARNTLLSKVAQDAALKQGAPAPVSQATQKLLESRLAQMLSAPAGTAAGLQLAQ